MATVDIFSALTLRLPLLSDSPQYLDNVSPDFRDLSTISLIGTAADPFHYSWVSNTMFASTDDTAPINATEGTVTLSANIPVSDPIPMVLTEEKTIFATLGSSDTLAVGISDIGIIIIGSSDITPINTFEEVIEYYGETSGLDPPYVGLAEAALLYAELSSTDNIILTTDEVNSELNLKLWYESTDNLDIAVTDSISNISSSVTAIDDLTLAVEDGSTGQFSKFASDTIELSIFGVATFGNTIIDDDYLSTGITETLDDISSEGIFNEDVQIAVDETWTLDSTLSIEEEIPLTIDEIPTINLSAEEQLAVEVNDSNSAIGRLADDELTIEINDQFISINVDRESTDTLTVSTIGYSAICLFNEDTLAFNFTDDIKGTADLQKVESAPLEITEESFINVFNEVEDTIPLTLTENTSSASWRQALDVAIFAIYEEITEERSSYYDSTVVTLQENSELTSIVLSEETATLSINETSQIAVETYETILLVTNEETLTKTLIDRTDLISLDVDEITSTYSTRPDELTIGVIEDKLLYTELSSSEEILVITEEHSTVSFNSDDFLKINTTEDTTFGNSIQGNDTLSVAITDKFTETTLSANDSVSLILLDFNRDIYNTLVATDNLTVDATENSINGSNIYAFERVLISTEEDSTYDASIKTEDTISTIITESTLTNTALSTSDNLVIYTADNAEGAFGREDIDPVLIDITETSVVERPAVRAKVHYYESEKNTEIISTKTRTAIIETNSKLSFSICKVTLSYEVTKKINNS